MASRIHLIKSRGAGEWSSVLHQFLCSQLVDKGIALIFVCYGIHLSLSSISEKRGWLLAIILIKSTLHNGLLLIRHRPDRVSLNPVYWIVAMLGAHWYLFYGIFRVGESVALLPHSFLLGLSLSAVFLFMWARICLGRNYGVIPAQRRIITSGVYRYMRHPIYTAAFLGELAYVLGHFSATNVLICTIGMGIIVLKALFEESFLSETPSYVRYRSRVKFRFVPGVV